MKSNNQADQKVYRMAIDLGTSSAKLCCATADGSVLLFLQKPYSVHSAGEYGAEQYPDEILEATSQLIREAVQRLGQPAALGFSAAMHGLMGMDAGGRALSALLIWSDRRSMDAAEQLKAAMGKMIYAHSGVPVHPMLPVCKWMYWNQRMEPWFPQVRWWVSVKEYVLYHLTGEVLTDYAMAGATGMFDINTRQWNMDVLSYIGLERRRLPEIVSPLTWLRTDARCRLVRQSGLVGGILVMVGSTDGCLAAIGSGLAGTEDVSITIGTSGAVRRWLPHPLMDPGRRLFCYMLLPGHYIIGGALNNGGGAVTQFTEVFGEADYRGNVKHFVHQAMMAPPGCEGLMCLPYFLGERSPVWDPLAQGAFVGIRATHRAMHFQRALLEGIGFSVKQLVDLLEELTGPSRQIWLSGGIVHIPEWTQLLADITGRELYVRSETDASCTGVLTLMALPASADILPADLCDGLSSHRNQSQSDEEQHYIPDPNTRSWYAQLFPRFVTLYPLLFAWQQSVNHSRPDS